VIPEPGRSVREQFAADPSMFCPEWIAAGSRWFDESQQGSLAREFLFHDCDDATIAWALESVEMFDTRNLVTEPSVAGPWPDVPVASIVATEDRTLSPEWIERASRQRLRQEPIAMRAGHCPHVSRPEELAELLVGLADRRITARER